MIRQKFSRYWSSWTVKWQVVPGALAAMLAGWNMMPAQVKMIFPANWQTAIAVFLFFNATVIVPWLRMRREPR